ACGLWVPCGNAMRYSPATRSRTEQWGYDTGGPVARRSVLRRMHRRGAARCYNVSAAPSGPTREVRACASWTSARPPPRCGPISATLMSTSTSVTTATTEVVTDVVRDGRPVVGYGFNSNGRYAVGGLLRERFIPRLLRASP